MRFFLRLSYDGTDYHGWQRQPNSCSVQQTIEEALSVILQNETFLVGAGRTDAGVHAREMYAHFDAGEIKDRNKFLTSINRLVGNNISIHDIFQVKPDAHARFDALSRSYIYQISLCKDPFLHRYAHRLYKMPDIFKMNEAASILLNTDDFTSFAKLHSDVKTNFCNVSHAHWNYSGTDHLLTFSITADRFLRNMVRAVVGTLLDVGTGNLSVDDFCYIIDKRDRCAAGMSVPAKGLFLSKIVYPEEIFIL